MEWPKNASILLIFAFSLFIPPSHSFASHELQTAKNLQLAEAKIFELEYTKDLQQRISEEKYETIPDIWEGFSLRQSGSLKNETAYRILSPREFTKIRNQLMLSETGKFTDNLRFKVSGRAYYDAVYDGTNNFPKNVASDMKTELEFRDSYIDYSSGPFDLRLGKQQIVWGEAVALFFADVVNARDLREFILPDFDMIRIPQVGADIEYSKNNFHAELVWLPILEFDKLGVSGSEFAFPLPLPSSDTPLTYVDANAPKNSFNNSEAGMRLSYLLNGWDISAFYLHTWNKSPVYYRMINSGVYNFSPEYKRLDVYGTTFAKEINDIVFKGELVFNNKDYFPVIDPASQDGIVRKRLLNYLLGVNYTFFNKIDLDLQFMQKIIFDFDEHIYNQKRINNSLAFWIKTDFLNGKLEPELTVVTSLMDLDAMYRPRINLKFKDNWLLRFGVDYFQGKSDGLFGEFDKKSRFYSELSYNF